MGSSSVSDPVTAFLHRWQSSSGHLTSRQLTRWLATCWDEGAGPIWMPSWRLNFNKLGGWGDCQGRRRKRCKVKDDWNKFIGIRGPWEVAKVWKELRFRNEDKNNQTQICGASEGPGVVASPATVGIALGRLFASRKLTRKATRTWDWETDIADVKDLWEVNSFSCLLQDSEAVAHTVSWASGWHSLMAQLGPPGPSLGLGSARHHGFKGEFSLEEEPEMPTVQLELEKQRENSRCYMSNSYKQKHSSSSTGLL